MVSQNCPRCASERVRRGYRPTPIWKKIFFRFHLLCDDCNWEYTGFAIPGTVSTKPTKRIRKLKLEETSKNLSPSSSVINSGSTRISDASDAAEENSSHKRLKKKESKSSFEQ
jgi:ribosomal protein L37AE/L43A